jgi:hypothetical protein
MFDHLNLKPHPTIWNQMETFKNMNGLGESSNVEVIAMQIRRGTKQTSYEEIATIEMENSFFQCAIQMAKSEEVRVT